MTIINPNNKYQSVYLNTSSKGSNPMTKSVDDTIFSALENNLLLGVFEKIDSRLGSVTTAFGKILLPIDSFQIGKSLLVLKEEHDLITILAIPNQNISSDETSDIISKRDYGRYGDYIQINPSSFSAEPEVKTVEPHLISTLSKILNDTLFSKNISNLTEIGVNFKINTLAALAATIYSSNESGNNVDEEELFTHLRAISSATANLNWQVFLLPYGQNGKVHFINCFKRRKSKNAVIDFENYIFEGSNKFFGKFSLIVLYSKQLSMMELIFKYSNNAPENVVDDIKKTFLECSNYFNMQPKFNSKKQSHDDGSGLLGEILQEYCKNKAFTVLA